MKPHHGGVRERPNRHDWKSCVLQGTVGSNPTSSAAKDLVGSGSTTAGRALALGAGADRQSSEDTVSDLRRLVRRRRPDPGVVSTAKRNVDGQAEGGVFYIRVVHVLDGTTDRHGTDSPF